MVAVTMVAFRKQRNRIDVPDLQCFLKMAFIKLLSDSGNQATGVEVEVNLAKA